jgi:hypothetical protein
MYLLQSWCFSGCLNKLYDDLPRLKNQEKTLVLLQDRSYATGKHHYYMQANGRLNVTNTKFSKNANTTNMSFKHNRQTQFLKPTTDASFSHLLLLLLINIDNEVHLYIYSMHLLTNVMGNCLKLQVNRFVGTCA